MDANELFILEFFLINLELTKKKHWFLSVVIIVEIW